MHVEQKKNKQFFNYFHIKIAWYFNGILLSLNSIRIINNKYYSIENPLPNEWILVIDPVNTIHDGQYSCHVNNGLKKNINLRVGSRN